MTLTLKDPNEQLDRLFAELDDGEKLAVSLMTLAQCGVGYRRMVALNQYHHASEFARTDNAVAAAAATGDQVVVDSVRDIRTLLESALADPPPSNDSQFRPVGEAFRRDFLWTDAYEEPVYYDLRHAARAALDALRIGGVPG